MPIIIAVLVFANLLVWSAVYSTKLDDLEIYFFDVGQGDSILIESPLGNRVLIDGGPNRKVLSELGKALPFGDRRIDVVIATHPDSDHITGLVEVLKRFDVGVFIESGATSSNEVDDILQLTLKERGVKSLVARRGMSLSLGASSTLSILFPEGSVSGLETNEASVVGKLLYGEKSFLFTGDSPKRTEYLLLSWDEKVLDVDVLQVGHHGSDTSTSPLFVQKVSPEYAVISAGKDNRYGHPHPNVVKILENLKVKILGTYELGTIKFETDGENLRVK